MKMTITKPWTDQTVQFILSGTTSPKAVKSQTLNVQARWTLYGNSAGQPQSSVLVISDSSTKKIYIIQGECDFYVSDSTGLTGVTLGPGGELLWSPSYVALPSEGNDAAAAIARFERDFDAGKVVQQISNSRRINLNIIDRYNPTTGNSFFIRGSAPIKPKIAAVEVTDQVLHLDLTNPGTKAIASFWINLTTGVITKATLDGKPIDLAKASSPKTNVRPSGDSPTSPQK